MTATEKLKRERREANRAEFDWMEARGWVFCDMGNWFFLLESGTTTHDGKEYVWERGVMINQVDGTLQLETMSLDDLPILGEADSKGLPVIGAAHSNGLPVIGAAFSIPCACFTREEVQNLERALRLPAKV